MRYKKFWYALICVLLAMTTVVFLGKKSYSHRVLAKFSRHKSNIGSVIVISKNLGYTNIVSLDNDSSVFLNVGFNGLIINNHTSLNMLTKSIDIKPKIEAGPQNIFVLNGLTNLHNTIFAFEGNRGEVFTLNGTIRKRIKTDFSFNNPVLIDSSSFIFRMNTIKEEFVFGKYDFKKNELSTSNLDTKLPFNGNLATDGMLVYDNHKTLYFIHYYTSKIIQLDTALKVMKTFKTIDGSEKAPKVTFLPKVKTYQFASPRDIVNDKAAVFENHLYIVSGVLAQNDKDFISRNSHRIDCYDTETGEYKTSYYLDKKKYGARVMDILIKKRDELYILTNRNLIKISV